jgi:nucleoside-diphosphate-sugar epimerase
MKIIVTGGTGFLGRHIVWRLADIGAEVIFTGRSANAAADVQLLAKNTVHWQPLEHGSSEAGKVLSGIAENADAIVHCAALSSPWGKADVFERANVGGTQEVLKACHHAKVPRLVHISTPSLYFNYSDRLAIKEGTPLPPPVNDYARTKAAAEQLILANPPAETVILRPRALFGPWDQTIVPRILRVMKNGTFPIMRGGHIQLDLTYIDNAVDAVLLALTKPLARSVVTYNVSNGEPQELSALLHLIASEFKIPLTTRKIPWPIIKTLAHGLEIVARLGNTNEPLLTRYSAGVIAFSQTLDITSLRDELGYRPKISIAEGIRRHAMWWHGQEMKALK